MRDELAFAMHGRDAAAILLSVTLMRAQQWKRNGHRKQRHHHLGAARLRTQV